MVTLYLIFSAIAGGFSLFGIQKLIQLYSNKDIQNDIALPEKINDPNFPDIGLSSYDVEINEDNSQRLSRLTTIYKDDYKNYCNNYASRDINVPDEIVIIKSMALQEENLITVLKIDTYTVELSNGVTLWIRNRDWNFLSVYKPNGFLEPKRVYYRYSIETFMDAVDWYTKITNPYEWRKLHDNYNSKFYPEKYL